jgi:Cd2+/Zn2+-exporting ATPase
MQRAHDAKDDRLELVEASSCEHKDEQGHEKHAHDHAHGGGCCAAADAPLPLAAADLPQSEPIQGDVRTAASCKWIVRPKKR